MGWASATPVAAGSDILVYGRTANLSVSNGLNGLSGSLNTYGIQGQLVLSSDANASLQPVARLVRVNSNRTITIAGLFPRSNI